MNDKAKKKKDLVVPDDIKLPAAAAQRGISPHVWSALKTSYQASDGMILTLVDYCHARGLDPMLKPVHIVSTHSDGKKIESIWPGIASYRITASRTGQYAGNEEPSFGPPIERAWGQLSVVYPESCKFRLHRFVAGHRCTFTAVVRWEEEAARQRSGAPNHVWARRPYGQLAKVAEAAALRMAFPTELGGENTAEEMEGKILDAIDVTPVTAPRPRREEFKAAQPPAAPAALYDLVDEVGEVIGTYASTEFDKHIGGAISRLAKTLDLGAMEQLISNNEDALASLAEEEKERHASIREFYALRCSDVVAASPNGGGETLDDGVDSSPAEFLWVSTNGRENRMDSIDRWLGAVIKALGRCPDIGMLSTSRKKNASALAEYHSLGGKFAEAVETVEKEFSAIQAKLTATAQ